MSLSLDFVTLSEAYWRGTASPSQVVDAVFDRIEAKGEDGVWIALAPREDALARASALETLPPESRAELSLFGLPFSVKDNIDVGGLPTTAACPAFSYSPAISSPVVNRLIEAGAIPIGKTNLDQFATGLAGVRSPYGIPRNPFDPRYIPGGSSSGPAVSVASGLVSSRSAATPAAPGAFRPPSTILSASSRRGAS
jgi:Asp-tRNA(Asn)/Glu-tRNA(Gln) amidotransferase A subunit family amidase